jgi:predicted GTPase
MAGRSLVRYALQNWRVIVLIVLLAAPVGFLAGYGSYQLWYSGWSFWAWWPMMACFALAYLLGWHWQRRKKLLEVDFTPPLHWTDRDREAWRLVEARAKGGAQLGADRLSAIDFYVETAQAMAGELARFYHPRAEDPIGSLTIPEILAVVELAAHDLAQMVDEYLPGGHLLTIKNWRQAKQLSDWYQTASNVYWLIAGFFNPIGTGVRYVASQAGLSRPLQMLQENLLLWFYTAYVHRLGTYLIDLDSGRLRVGAERYRALMQQHAGPPPAADGKAAEPDPADLVPRVTLTILGQAKTGKSSLINALLGEQRAKTDVLPATAAIARYELKPEDMPNRLVLLDTVGYGHTGPKEDQLRATEDAAQQSDLLLLVMHATNPARQADLQMLAGLRQWFEARPDLKMPPVLGVLTHIDLLRPALEWSPPYNWPPPPDSNKPLRPKERQIADAVAAAQEQLGKHLVGVVPVCGAAGKVYGVEEWLLPAMAELLDQAHAVALLRCLRAEVDVGKVRKVFYQMLASGKKLVRTLWEQPHTR